MTVVAPSSRADVGDKVNYTLTATNIGQRDAHRRDGRAIRSWGARVHAAAAGDAGSRARRSSARAATR